MGSVALRKQVTDVKNMPETRGTYQVEAMNEVKELIWVPQEQFNIQSLLHSKKTYQEKNATSSQMLTLSLKAKSRQTHWTETMPLFFS